MQLDIRVPAAETVHAAPTGGLTFCACCDATPSELGAYDRMSASPALVTCGRLSAADEQLLLDCTTSTD